MLGWVSRCWGGMGVNSTFQKARVRSVIADWQVPQDNDVSILISSFKGQNPDIEAQAAFNSFLSHLQMSEQKGNPLFLLKHLFIFDHAVEEGVALDKIANYYSSQFFIFKQGSSIECKSMFKAVNPLRQMVATYFLYIKKKAQIYLQFEPKYYAVRKAERELLIHPLSFTEIFSVIDKSFDIQKAINEINNKYRSHNKGSELIKMIFTMMLKTYLFCYSLVSISTKTLFCRINKYNKTQMIRFYRFIRYYNKEYTRQLYDFIQTNKDIYEFKNFKYSEIILIDQSYVDYLEKIIYKLDKQPLALSSPETVNVEEEEKIETLPNEIFLEVVETLIVDHQLKKKFNVAPVDHQLMLQFEQYQNCFSDTFESDFQSSRRQEYNERQAKNPETDAETQLTSSKCLSTSKRLEFEETMCSSKFDNDIWNSWQNVYSS